MPNDPTLYPSIADPTQRMMQQIAALDARVAAMEGKRDIAITTIRNDGTFRWNGGRVWVIGLGNGISGAAGSWIVQLRGNAGTITSTGVSPTAASQQLSIVIGAVTLTPAVLTGTYFANPGDDIHLYIASTGVGAGTYTMDLLVIEWPQA